MLRIDADIANQDKVENEDKQARPISQDPASKGTFLKKKLKPKTSRAQEEKWNKIRVSAFSCVENAGAVLSKVK